MIFFIAAERISKSFYAHYADYTDKTNGNNDKKLPQTNGESNWQLSLLGVGVLALALLVWKKKILYRNL